MSTTDSSDWEAGGPGIRARSEPPLPGPEPPLVPTLMDGTAAARRSSGSPPNPQSGAQNGFIRTLASAGILGGKATARPSSSGNAVTSRGPIAYPVPFPPPPPDRFSQEQTETVDLTLDQMVASQDIDATPSQLAFLARVSGRGTPSSRGRARGLGRGSRGGRPPKIKIEPPQEEGTPTTEMPKKVNKGGRPRGSRAGQSSALSTRPINRGGRPRGSRAGTSSASSSTTGRGLSRGGPAGLKRKRKSGEGEDKDDEDANSDSSEEITSLPTQSRSGRRITQVVTPTPHGAFEADSPSSLNPLKRPSALIHPSDLSSTQKPAKRKRVTLSAVCKNCGRGHSPQSNQIVFCDGCNTPWHQYCHDRPITPTVIQEEDKEWHCGDCEVQAEEAAFMVGRIPPPEGMGLAERRRAFDKMERAELIAILLAMTEVNQDFPWMKRSQRETWTAALSSTQAPVVNEAEYDDYDEPLPYPSAGNNGLRLPSEEEDMGLLVDETVKTYSHSWVIGDKWAGRLAEEASGDAIMPGSFAIEVGA